MKFVGNAGIDRGWVLYAWGDVKWRRVELYAGFSLDSFHVGFSLQKASQSFLITLGLTFIHLQAKFGRLG